MFGRLVRDLRAITGFQGRLGVAVGMEVRGSGQESRIQYQLSECHLSSLEELLTTQCDRFSQEEVSGGGAGRND